MPTYTQNNVNYTYVVGSGIASVSRSATASGNITLLSDFVVNGATYNVTSIDIRAFQQCPGITSITIGSYLTTIGEYAFFLCTGLTSITIPPSVTTIGPLAFLDCTSLTSITIPPLVTTLRLGLFQRCSSLANVSLHSSITSIEGSCFHSCSSLTSFTIPPLVTTIPMGVFNSCTSLASITIPPFITSIPAQVDRYGNSSSAFHGCSNLATIVIQTYLSNLAAVFHRIDAVNMSVTFDYSGIIPSSVFRDRTNLKTIIIGNQITQIGTYAFWYATGVTSVTIGSSVTTIGDYAFRNNTSLLSIVFPQSLTTTGWEVFRGCTSLSNIITIPSGLTTLNNGLFDGCTSLNTFIVKGYISGFNALAIPNSQNLSVTFDYAGMVPYSACAMKTNLKTVILSNSITRIDTNAFYGCSGLTNITLPASITSIGDQAFDECTTLNSVSFLGNIPTIGWRNFTSTTDTSFYVVDGQTNTNPAAVNTSLSMFTNKTLISVGNPTISNFSIPSKTFGNAQFTIVDPTSNSGGAFSYTSSDLSVATVSGKIITIVAPGTAIITATQETNYKNGIVYTSGTIDATFFVDKPAPQLGVFSIPNKSLSDVSFLIVDPTKPNDSTGTWTYTSSDINKATVSGNEVTLVSSGRVTITATISSDSTYSSTSVTRQFSISEPNVPPSTITFVSPADVVNAIPITVQPVGTTVSLSSAIFTPAKLETFNPSSGTSDEKIENRNKLINALFSMFTTVNTISIPPSAFYMPAAIEAANITEVKLIKTSGTTSESPLLLNATAFNLSTAFFCGIDEVGNSVLMNGTNTYAGYSAKITKMSDNEYVVVRTNNLFVSTTSTAVKGDVIYTAGFKVVLGSVTGQLSILKLVTLSNFSLPVKTIGDTTFTITPPTTNSDGALTYTSSNTAVATIAGNVVTVVGVGTSTITASQPMTEMYLAGSITATLTVNRITTTLSNFTVPAKTFGNEAFTITPPTSNSAGAFTYTSSNLSVATIVGNVITIVGAGNSTITANQAITANYTSGMITSTLTVGRATPTMTDFSISSKTVEDAAFTIPPPTTNSTGAFTYTSSNPLVATIVGNVITPVALGTSIISVVQALTDNYTSGTVTTEFQVNKVIPTLTNFSIPSKIIGNPTFAITPPTSNSDGVISYASSDTTVAAINGNRITIKKVGSAIITATQATTAYYAVGTVTATFEVTFASTVLSNFTIPTKKFGDIPFKIQTSSNSSGGITYTSSDEEVATIVGDMVTILGAGSLTITATQEGWNNYSPATITTTLTISEVTTVLSNFSVPAKKVGDATFTLVPPSTNSNGAFTYTSSNTDVATVAGNLVTIIGAGISTITAEQASTSNYTSETITATLQVSPNLPVITNFSIPSKTFGDAPFTLAPPSSNSTGAFTYTSLNSLIATVAGNVVTIVGVGNATIIATQASSANYVSGTITAQIVVTKSSSTLTNFSVTAKKFGDAAFTLVPPTSNSNAIFTYTSSNFSVATIVKNVVTINGIGDATITAVQASSVNYTSGTISTTFTVSQATPVLTNFSFPAKTVGASNFALVPPTTNSDGYFSYTSSDHAVATIDDDDIVTIVGVGSTTITATQSGTTNFESGTITATLQVNRISAVLTNFSVGSKTFGDASFNLVPPTTNSDGLITYTSSDPNVATIDGSTVTIVGSGNTTIIATQESTADYGSGTVSTLFQVNKMKTTLSDFSVATKIIGEEAFAITPPTTNGDGAFTYTSSNHSVATIEGDIITIVGLGNATITALQASTANYTSDTITTVFQVKLIRTVLSNFSVPSKTVGDAFFTLVPPTTNSDGAFTYTSSNKLIATVSGNTVTVVGTGNVSIIANQEGTTNSTPAQITASLIVNKATNSISWFSVPEKAFGNAPFELTPPTTMSNGLITYTSSNGDVATISKNIVTIVGIGTAFITANQAATVNYSAGTITATLSVISGTPSLSNFLIPAKTVGSAAFSIVPPTTRSNGAFTYNSSNTDVATVEGDVVTIVGVGSSTITANQASTEIFVSGTITTTLQVNPITNVLTNFVVPTKIFGAATFAITPPTSNSNGSFTYTSLNQSVATIVDDIVTIVGAGDAIITATQASTSSYTSATVSALFQVTPMKNVLTNFAVPAKNFGDAAFALVPPTTASNGAFTYASSNEDVATIEGDTVTIVGLGTCRITAQQASTTNYTSDTIASILQVNMVITALSNFSVPSKQVGSAAFSLVPPTSNTNGAITYTSLNSLVARVAGDVVTVVGVGSCIIIATQSGTINSTSGTISASFVVTKSSPTITNFVVPEKAFGNAPFTLVPPTTNGAGAFSYSSTNGDVATIARNVVTIVGVGTSTIIATQAGSADYVSGTITATLTVTPGTTVLTNFSVPTKTFGSSAFSLVAPTTNGDGLITYSSSNGAVATVDGSTITIVGAGSSIITADQASTSKYTSGTITASLTVNPITTILTSFSVESKALGSAAFSLVPPTTNSDGAFTYTSSNGAVATIDGSTLTVIGGGSSTITAVQASTANYTSSTITALFRVSSLTTVLSNFTVPTKSVGNEPFAITPPTTNGDGAFTYRSSNTAIATVAGNMVTIVGAGSVNITAEQASSESYTSATITSLFIVNKGTSAITNFTMPVKEAGMADFTITDPSSNSIGAFTYTSSNAKVATIFKNTVSIKGIGTSTITASQAMSANHIAGTVTTPFVVNQISPTLTTNFVVPAAKTMGDAKFKLIAPKSNSTSAFTFSSSNTAVATIVKDTVTLVGAGTTTITATQPSAKNFGSRAVAGTLTVNPKIAFLTNFLIPPKIVGTAPFAIIPPTTNSNGAFTYTSLNTEVATIAGNMITIVGVGTATITADQASTANFTTGTISASLVVNLPTPQVGPLQITNKLLTNPTFTIVDPTKPSDNTGTWSYTSSNTDKATISGNEVTLLEPGFVTITGTLSSDSTYNSIALMTQFSISDLAPSSFVFVRSAEVAAAIPATVPALLNTVIPLTVSTPANIAKFNPALGSILEKQANHSMVVNTLCNMFPSAVFIKIPTPLFYVPLSFNKTKLKDIKILRPIGTTPETPLIPIMVKTDSAIGFLCSFVNGGNSVQLNGIGTFAGSFIKIVKRVEDSKYTVIKSLKGIPTTTIALMGDVISFIGITAMISYV